MKLIKQLDTGIYQVLHKFRKLTKKQQRIVYGLLILLVFFLINFINAQFVDNAMWLEGNWSSQSNRYTIKTKNGECQYWNIKQNDFFLMKDAQIAVNSSKGNIVLTKSGSNTEYHLIKIDKNHLGFQIFNNQKKIKELKLQRTK